MAQKSIYWIFLVLLIFQICLIGLSRVMFGVHSINQVLYGSLYGLWVALFLFWSVRPIMRLHLESLMERRDTQPKYYINEAVSIWIIYTLLTIINFMYTDKYYVTPPEYEKTMVEKCGITSIEQINGWFHYGSV